MTPRSRKVAVFVGTAALAAGAGIGVASQGTSSAAIEPGSAPGMMRGAARCPSAAVARRAAHRPSAAARWRRRTARPLPSLEPPRSPELRPTDKYFCLDKATLR
jgi:hypothetical protein